MKIGISALLFNLENALDLCEKLRNINHIELGIDNLSECKTIYKYINRINQLDLTLGIHLPMEFNTCDNIEYINNSWLKFFSKIENELKEFNIKYYNLHLGYVISSRLEKNREKYLDISSVFLDNLSKMTDSNITIENVYSNGGDFSNIGNKLYDFEYIFNKVKNKKLSFCYDTGHYLINRDDYINVIKDKIKVIHLSDNDGISDLHIGLGKGILTKEHIKKLLNTNAEYLILEINHNNIEESIKILENIKKR